MRKLAVIEQLEAFNTISVDWIDDRPVARLNPVASHSVNQFSFLVDQLDGPVQPNPSHPLILPLVDQPEAWKEKLFCWLWFFTVFYILHHFKMIKSIDYMF